MSLPTIREGLLFCCARKVMQILTPIKRRLKECRVVVKQFPSRHPLPLPMGEAAERSEDGEGK